MENYYQKLIEELNRQNPGALPEDAATRMPPAVGQEFASRIPTAPTESPFDVHVSDTTVPMAGKIEMPKSFEPGVPPKPRYEVENDAPTSAPIVPPPSVPSKPVDKATVDKQDAAILTTDNDKAAREAGIADLNKRRGRNLITELAAGAGDAISAGASAFGGNAPGGSQARLVERHEKDMEQGKKDVEMKLRNDANSDISKQYQQLLGQFLKKDPKDPTILGLTANQIAEKIPAVEKIAAMRQQDDLTRLKLEENRLLKTQLAKDKSDKAGEDLWTPLGTAKTKNDAKLIKDAHSSYLDSKMGVQELIDLRKSKGAEFMDREAVAKGKMAAANLLLQYKTLVKLGVLSKDDYRLLDRIVPQDPLQVDVMEDTPAKLAQFDKEVDRKMDAFARSYGVTSPVKADKVESVTTKPTNNQRKTKAGHSYIVEP